MDKLDPIITRRKACEVFAISRSTLWRRNTSGDFPPLDVPNGWLTSTLVKYQERLRAEHQQRTQKTK